MSITSNEIKSFYSGIILSDGTIDKGVHKRALRMRVIKKQFTDYCEEFTEKYTNFEYYTQYKTAYIDNKFVNHKESWNFNIKAHPYFNKLYHLFYDDYRKKYINKEILNCLDLRGLANWYMGDGYITLVGRESNNIKNRRTEICTDCFSKADNDLFASFLKEKFGYDAKVIKHRNFFRISIGLHSAQNFLMDIKPYILPCYHYKLNMKYEIKPEWMRNDYFEFMQELNKAPITFNEVKI